MNKTTFSKNKFTSIGEMSQKKKFRDLWQSFLFVSQGNSDEYVVEKYHETVCICKEWLGWIVPGEFSRWVSRKLQENSKLSLVDKDEILKSAYDIYVFVCSYSQIGPDKSLLNLIGKDLSGVTLQNQPTIPWSFCLWNLRSSHNAGSITRTTECMGLESIYLLGYTPGPDVAGFCAASMGTHEKVKILSIEESFQALREQAHNKKIIALETGAESVSIRGFDWPLEGGIIIAGNEEMGLSKEVVEQCDFVVSIPLFGAKESLNVANACAICAWELRRNQGS